MNLSAGFIVFSDIEHLMPQETIHRSSPITFSKWRVVKRTAVRFILPLGLVYLCEYFINQGIVISIT